MLQNMHPLKFRMYSNMRGAEAEGVFGPNCWRSTNFVRSFLHSIDAGSIDAGCDAPLGSFESPEIAEVVADIDGLGLCRRGSFESPRRALQRSQLSKS